MTWQYGRNLTSVNGVTYGYNADGLRVSKSGAKTTEYYLVGDQYIGEVTTIGETDYVISYVYDESDSIIGINVNGNPYFFAKNLQGDVVAILNYQGSIVARYTYDVWGKLIAVKNGNGAAVTSETHVAMLNPFRYRGYMYDSETGFYYLRSRYYDPEVGRFLNADDTNYLGFEGDVLSYNLYMYCGNNPVMGYDVNGAAVFWRTLKKLGAETIKAGIVVAGIASSVAMLISVGAAIIGSGGVGVIAISAVMTLAVSATQAAVATAVAGAGVAAVGTAGEIVKNTKHVTKGKSFRGGSKKQRDKWYGYNDKKFHKWYERVGKRKYNDGMDIENKKIADKMFKIWKSLGCPFPK